jgi:hypothetical protein
MRSAPSFFGFEETTGMVSSAVDMTDEEVLRALKRLCKLHSDDPEYKRLRRDRPQDWRI